MKSKSEMQMFVLSIRTRLKSTGEEQTYRYSCLAASLDAALTKAENMIKIDPRREFVSAIQTRIKK